MKPRLKTQLLRSMRQSRQNAKRSIPSMENTLMKLRFGAGAVSEQARILSDRRALMEGIVQAHEWIDRIDAAMERVRQGQYGICVDCAAPIGEQRLTAQPWSERCTECQHRHEQSEFQLASAASETRVA
jgi:DnaK suppressor protein